VVELKSDLSETLKSGEHTLGGWRLSWASVSLVGRRERNEDKVCVPGPENDPVCIGFAIADGLGGHGGGDIAADGAATAAEWEWRSARPGEDTRARVKRSLEAANKAVLELRERSGLQHASIGSTLVILYCTAREFVWGNVGDCRLYRFSGGSCRQLTTDQSVAAALICSQGGSGDVRSHPDRSKLFSSLGGEGVSFDVGQPERPRDGDAFLLCSDGLWEPVHETRLSKHLQMAHTPAEWLRSLVAEVQGRAAADQDNFSAIAVFVRGVPGAATGACSPRKAMLVTTAVAVFGVSAAIGGYSLLRGPLTPSMSQAQAPAQTADTQSAAPIPDPHESVSDPTIGSPVMPPASQPPSPSTPVVQTRVASRFCLVPATVKRGQADGCDELLDRPVHEQLKDEAVLGCEYRATLLSDVALISGGTLPSRMKLPRLLQQTVYSACESPTSPTKVSLTPLVTTFPLEALRGTAHPALGQIANHLNQVIASCAASWLTDAVVVTCPKGSLECQIRFSVACVGADLMIVAEK
jgi:serine/threonine protein phosphatase PrpC